MVRCCTANGGCTGISTEIGGTSVARSLVSPLVGIRLHRFVSAQGVLPSRRRDPNCRRSVSLATPSVSTWLRRVLLHLRWEGPRICRVFLRFRWAGPRLCRVLLIRASLLRSLRRLMVLAHRVVDCQLLESRLPGRLPNHRIREPVRAQCVPISARCVLVDRICSSNGGATSCPTVFGSTFAFAGSSVVCEVSPFPRVVSWSAVLAGPSSAQASCSAGFGSSFAFCGSPIPCGRSRSTFSASWYSFAASPSGRGLSYPLDRVSRKLDTRWVVSFRKCTFSPAKSRHGIVRIARRGAALPLAPRNKSDVVARSLPSSTSNSADSRGAGGWLTQCLLATAPRRPRPQHWRCVMEQEIRWKRVAPGANREAVASELAGRASRVRPRRDLRHTSGLHARRHATDVSALCDRMQFKMRRAVAVFRADEDSILPESDHFPGARR